MTEFPSSHDAVDAAFEAIVPELTASSTPEQITDLLVEAGLEAEGDRAALRECVLAHVATLRALRGQALRRRRSLAAAAACLVISALIAFWPRGGAGNQRRGSSDAESAAESGVTPPPGEASRADQPPTVTAEEATARAVAAERRRRQALEVEARLPRSDVPVAQWKREEIVDFVLSTLSMDDPRLTVVFERAAAERIAEAIPKAVVYASRPDRSPSGRPVDAPRAARALLRIFDTNTLSSAMKTWADRVGDPQDLAKRLLELKP